MSKRVLSSKISRISKAIGAFAGVAASLIALTAARVEAQSPVQFSGTTNVGQSSQPVTVVITMTGRGVVSSLKAVTQGIADIDYSLAGGGTCSIGSSYTAGQQCTANIVFAPKYPGIRSGAVVIQASDGSLLGSTLLVGLAKGSLPMLAPGRIDTVAGDADWVYQGDGNLATHSPIFLPMGVVTDTSGNLYLSDSQNNRVRRVDAQSKLMVTVAGNGSPGYSGENLRASSSSISAPSGMTLDGAGNIYFADTGNHIVRRVDAFTGLMSTVAGSPGAQGYAGDGGPAQQARLSLPQSVGFDLAGNLLIADTGNNVIREVDATSGSIRTIAGTGVGGFNGDGQLATNSQLYSPWSVSLGQDGSIYIADSSNNRVRQITSSGIMTTVAGTGDRGFMGDGGAATLAFLSAPASVVLDPAGDLYIADSGNNRIRKIDASTGLISTIAGTASEQFTGDAGPADQASLYGPSALFFDASGNLFITDMFHNRVREINGLATALLYPIMQVGKVSAPIPVVLANSGNADLTIAQAVKINAAVDASTTTCLEGKGLLPANTCIVGAQFAPTSIGNPVQGSITLNSDSSFTAPVISLSGQVISVAPTTLTLTSSANPSLIGATITFSATVVNGNTPTGTIVFFDGTTQLCSVNLVSSSVACNVSALTLGKHSVTASYSGDANDAPSVSNILLQIVQQSPSLALNVTPNPAVVISPVTLNLTVTAPTGVPSGTVVFYDGNVALSGATLSASGTTTFSTSQLATGSHSLSAQYAGDAINAPAQSNIVLEVIQPATTVTILNSNNNPAAAGSSITFTAVVTSPLGISLTGTVQFLEGTVVLGTSTLGSNGSASFTSSTLQPGPHALVAVYSGDSDNATSSSLPLVQVVQSALSTTTINSSATTTIIGEPAVFTASVSSGTGVPTGTVTFHDGGNVLGQATLNAQSIATFSTTALTLGIHALTATYGGDNAHNASTSTQLQHTIILATTALTLAGPVVTIDAGAPFSMTAALTSNGIAPTGSLSLREGATTVATQTVTPSGTITFSNLSLTQGTHMLTAFYGGDNDNSPSTSATVSIIVGIAPTTTSLSSSAIKAAFGQSVTFTASVGSDSPTPGGTIQFMDGAVTLGTSAVGTNGIALLSTSTLGYGSHPIKAIYSGDSNHSASTSTVLNELIVGGATASLTSNVNPSSSGQNVVFTARINGVGSQVATGTVSFNNGAALIANVALDINGVATIQLSSLAVGSHTISASYSGDANYAPLSATMMQLVQSSSTITSLSSSANPSIFGTPLSLSAAVTTSGGIATGTVTFSDGGVALGTSQLGANGVATLTLNTLVTGSHAIVASYSGSSTSNPSTSNTLLLSVQQLTQLTVTSDANPTLTLIPIQLSAVISNSGGGSSTGSVTFSDGSTKLGSAPLNANGQAVLNLTSLSAGNHPLQATYSGDPSNFSSTSPTLVQTVLLRPTSVDLTATSTDPNNPQQITLIGVVHWSGPLTPTGSITFSNGNTVLGTGSVDSVGVATVTVILQSNANSIQAGYGGDAYYAPSTSLLTTITGGPATQFTMLVSPSSVSLQSKQHTTVNLVLSSVQNFSDTLQLGCLGLPFAATCTFSAPQVRLTANGQAVTQLTIDTGNPLGAGATAQLHGGRSSAVLLCFLPCGLFFVYGTWRSRKIKILPFLLLFGAVTATLSSMGCSGLQINGTPPGTYTFKVTAAGTGTGATQSQTMTLTVSQ
jgi:sugar lactone lactonase YvrE